MATAAEKFAQNLADLQRRLTALERGQQLENSTLAIGSEELTLPEAVGQGVSALTETVHLADVQANLDAAQVQLAADAVERDSRLTTAEGDIVNSKARLTTAEGDILSVFGVANTASADAAGAVTAAQGAQATADSASSAAATAASAAADAAGIANGKSTVLIQLTAPSAQYELPTTLWIDAPENTPRRWDGSAWTAVHDQAALDAATAAADAATAASNAQATADAAQTLAGTAESNAQAAITSAASKVRNLFSTSTPAGTAPQGSMWFKVDGTGQVLAQWQQTAAGDAGTWTLRPVTSEVISNLDVGKLSVGTATIAAAVAQSIAASTATIQTADIANLFATTATMDTAVAQKIYVAKLLAGKISAGEVLIGGRNLLSNANFEQNGAGWEDTTAYRTYEAPGTGYAGSASMVLNSTSQVGSYFALNNASLRPIIEAGDSYRISAWIKTTTAAVAGSARLYVRFYDNSGGTTGWLSLPSVSSPATLANVWTKVEGIVQAPEGSAAAVMGLYSTTSYAGAIRFSMPSMLSATDASLVVNGSIDAEALAAQIVLASKIIAGDPASTHAELSPTGFQVFADNGGSAPTEVVRLGVAGSSDYFAVTRADGTLAATISQDGVISGSQVNVDTALNYKGMELTALLDAKPKGLVAWGKRTTASTTAATTSTRMPYLRVDFLATPGRAYKVSTTPIWSSGNSTSAGTLVRLNYETSGSAAGEFSPVLTQDVAGERSYDNAWEGAGLTLSGIIYVSNPANVSVMLSFQAMGTGTVNLNANAAYPICIFIEDMGPLVSETGLDFNGVSAPTPPPIKTNYYKEFSLTGASSYTGSNGYYAYMENKMFQGESPAGQGNLSSVACFQSMTSTLSGATITDMRVYLYFELWYYNSGGTAWIGLHGFSSPPATFSESVSGFVASANWPRPGGRWVGIPSTYWAGFKSGAYKGISLHSPGGNYLYYGYAAENALLSVSYTK